MWERVNFVPINVHFYITESESVIISGSERKPLRARGYVSQSIDPGILSMAIGVLIVPL